MQDNTNTDAPGCFGSPSIYSPDSATCSACAASGPCGDKALHTLKAMQAKFDVSDLIAELEAKRKPARPIIRTTPRVRVAVLNEDDQQKLALISAKAREYVEPMLRAGKIAGALSALRRGENFFDSQGPKFLRPAVQMLLEGGFTKAMLKTRMMEELNWKETSVKPHVALICSFFPVFGFAEEQYGVFKMKDEV